MKIGEIILWASIMIVASLIVSMIVNPIIYTNLKNRVVGIFKSPVSTTKDALTEKCVESFEQCKQVYEKKYEISMSIVGVNKVHNLSAGNDFYNTWKASTQMGLESEYNSNLPVGERLNDTNFPLVLFAITLRGKEGLAPYVAVCDNQGNLIQYSKTVLSCG